MPGGLDIPEAGGFFSKACWKWQIWNEVYEFYLKELEARGHPLSDGILRRPDNNNSVI
jgi:hypothetical protein